MIITGFRSIGYLVDIKVLWIRPVCVTFLIAISSYFSFKVRLLILLLWLTALGTLIFSQAYLMECKEGTSRAASNGWPLISCPNEHTDEVVLWAPFQVHSCCFSSQLFHVGSTVIILWPTKGILFFIYKCWRNGFMWEDGPFHINVSLQQGFPVWPDGEEHLF